MEKQGITQNVRELLRLFIISEHVKKQKRQKFTCQQIPKETADRFHDLCKDRLGEETLWMSVRVELFSLFYLFQPEALFHQVHFSDDIVRYTSSVMGIKTPGVSMYKKNILFLYFNNKKFHDNVNLIVSEFEKKME